MSIGAILSKRKDKKDRRVARGKYNGEKLVVSRYFGSNFWIVEVELGNDWDLSTHMTKFFADRKFEGLMWKYKLIEFAVREEEGMEDVPWIVVLCPTISEKGEKYKPTLCNVWKDDPCADCPILKYYRTLGEKAK